jgi:hypothetical protein
MHVIYNDTYKKIICYKQDTDRTRNKKTKDALQIDAAFDIITQCPVYILFHSAQSFYKQWVKGFTQHHSSCVKGVVYMHMCHRLPSDTLQPRCDGKTVLREMLGLFSNEEASANPTWNVVVARVLLTDKNMRFPGVALKGKELCGPEDR